MSLLGVELSDAGILVAGGQPARLLETDQNSVTSPGYALPRKKNLLIGQAAEQMAHLFPQQILNHFWDQLSTEPLERSAGRSQNQAEVAFAHLKQIQDKVKAHGDSLVIAVPDHYTRTQLGLLLGMAQELGVSVQGFAPLSIAAVSNPEPGEILLYLDIHLHRMELTCLRQAERLQHADSMTMPGKGLLYWHREWVEAIATEFVHATRFDPLHRAESEQALYNRLKGIAAELKTSATARIELPAGQTTYRSAISSEQLMNKNTDCLNEIFRGIQQMLERWKPATDSPVALVVSHRIASLPGVARSLSDNAKVRVIEIAQGAGAMGVLEQWEYADGVKIGSDTVFQKSKPWASLTTESTAATVERGAKRQLPSHILYDSVAYPMGDVPLIITCDTVTGKAKIQTHGDPFRASGSHCIIERRGGQFFLEIFDMPEATINGQPVSGDTDLALGDSIQLGAQNQGILTIIACLQSDET